MSDELITALSIARQFVPNGTEAAERVDTAMRAALEAQIAAVAPAVDAQPVAILTREQIERIAHECETECHAVPGTTMYMCAEMAAEATLEAIASRVAQRADAQPVGVAATMPGTDGFTMAAFNACEVPVGTQLYASAQSEGLRKDAWQPIETAPKDGTEVLLIATRHSMLMPYPERIVGAYRNGWWSGPSTLSHVTHWMQLPEAPAALSQKDPQ